MNELAISLDSHSRIPLYEQIYEFIRHEIRRRQILPGERLPSSRALSSCLQVSRSTVDLAYDQLASEGYVESVPCRGYFVCDIAELYELEEKPADVVRRERAPERTFRYDFTASGIAKGGFPHNAWKKISREVLLDATEELFQLGPPQGEPGLLEAIAVYLHRARGVNCRPEQIIVGAGSDYLLMLLSAVLGEKRRVALEDPTYLAAFSCFGNLGHEVVSIPMDESGICVEELEASGAELAYVMPSHHFPMGTVMPVRRRMQLLAWAAERPERYLIEDDYDSEFRYRGKPIPALQGYDTGGSVIYLGTFSRAIAPSIRVSYLVLPERLLARYREREAGFSATVSRTDQRILEIFLRDGYFERHLNRMRAVYKGKHDLLLRLLRGLSGVCTVSGENAGVHVLLHFTNGLTAREAVKRAGERGVRIYDLRDYYRGGRDGAPADTVILGYASMTEEELTRAAAILTELFAGTDSQGSMNEEKRGDLR